MSGLSDLQNNEERCNDVSVQATVESSDISVQTSSDSFESFVSDVNVQMTRQTTVLIKAVEEDWKRRGMFLELTQHIFHF